MSRIPISPKHGVNPTLMSCFFCGEAKGVALLGRLKGDAEAPHSAIFDYEPCEECRKKFEQGVLLLEVDTAPLADGRAPIRQQENQKLYPTGKYCVITKEASERIFGRTDETLLVERGILDHLLSSVESNQPENNTHANTNVDEETKASVTKDDSFDEIISDKGEENESIQDN